MTSATTLRLLLVEDDEDDYILTTDTLNRVPGFVFEVTWASHYQAALELLEGSEFELCLLDYHLGPFTGVELLDQARRHQWKLPVVIFLTGQESHDLDMQAMRAGASDYLVKATLTVDSLERAIRYSLNQHQVLRRLERSHAELSRFAYVASHDLKEPLRAISGFAQLLQMRYAGRLDPQADEFIGHIVGGCNQIREMINALLDYSRLDREDLKLEQLRMSEVVRTALSRLEVAVLESGARFQIGHLPVIIGDRVKLQQVFQNLVSNAVKFRSDLPPVVSISAEELPTEFLFHVSDNGIGIKESDLTHAMEVFRRFHEDRAGTGVGLAICKKVVEQHGGTMWLESKFGEGTTVSFTIPKQVQGQNR